MEATQMNVRTLRMGDGNIIKLESHDSLESVRSLAREYAKAGYPDRYAVFAERQSDTSLTGSKLRSGQTERGVFLSCILRPSFFPSQAVFLGHLTAVSMAGALKQRCEKPIGIGWISEIFCNGKRIGKSTIETRLDAIGAYEYLIVNIGLKIREEDFPMRLSDMMHRVFADGSDSMPVILAQEILNRFFTLYSQLRTPAKFMDLYRQQFLLRGSKIRLNEGDKKISCKVLGVDPESGGLKVGMPDGTVRFLTKTNSVETPSFIWQKRAERFASSDGN